MKKKIVCILFAAVLAFSVPTRALAFGFAIPLAVEEVVIMLLGLCGITVSDDFDVEQFMADVQEQLDETGSNLTFASFLSGAAASKVLNTVAVDYAEIFASVLDVGTAQASASVESPETVLGCPALIHNQYYYTNQGYAYYMFGGAADAYWSPTIPSVCRVYMARLSSGQYIIFSSSADVGAHTYLTYYRTNRSGGMYQSQEIFGTYGEYVATTSFSGPYLQKEYEWFVNNSISVPTFANAQAVYDALAGLGSIGNDITVDDDLINGNATDIDYNSVNDRGVLTGAFSIDMGAIADAFGSIADAWAGVRENVRSWADVVSAGRVIPSINDKVIEDTATNESVVSDTSVADAAASIGDVGDYDLGLENFFPFCLPWDLYNFITLLEATPEAPVIEWEFPVDVEGNTEHYEWSLEDLEYLAEILRTFLTLAFAVGLIFVGGKLFKH